MSKITWSSRDQQALEELKRRRQEFMDAHRKPLIETLYRLAEVPDRDTAEGFADEMIRRADEFRDLLAPFDSGVRCAPPPDVKLG